MIHRALTNIDAGRRFIREGELVMEGELTPAVVEALTACSALARIAAPPLSALPGWRARARKLEAAGIRDAEQLIEARPETVGQILKVDPSRAKAMQEQAAGWLTAPPPAG